jgi:hypothetical protein
VNLRVMNCVGKNWRRKILAKVSQVRYNATHFIKSFEAGADMYLMYPASSRRLGGAVRGVVVGLVLALCLCPAWEASAATVLGADYDGRDLVVQNGDVLSGIFTNVGSFVIGAGDTVYVHPRVALSIQANLIEIAGVLSGVGAGASGGAAGVLPDLDGQSGSGSGGGQGGPGSCVFSSGGGGGGYGGSGGNGASGGFLATSNAPGGNSYGTDQSNFQMGSGGGGAGGLCPTSNGTGGAGGAGGGAIFLAAGSLSLTGTIIVDGAPGQSGNSNADVAVPGGGGGSGGAILLTGGALTLNGTLSAAGGAGAGYSGLSGDSGRGGGGGGGGVILVSGFTADGADFQTIVRGGAAGISAASTTAPAAAGQDGTFTDPEPSLTDTESVTYFSNANSSAGDALVHVTDPLGASALGSPSFQPADLCAMIYVFNTDQGMQECCGCPVSVNGLMTLDVSKDLASNADSGVGDSTDLSDGLITIVSTLTNGPMDAPCDPTGEANPLSPQPTLLAWGMHLQDHSITETPFSPVSTDLSAVTDLAAICAAVHQFGSGLGICTCGAGGESSGLGIVPLTGSTVVTGSAVASGLMRHKPR